MLKTYAYPNMPEGYCLVRTAELNDTMEYCSEMECQNANMAADMIRLVDQLDRLIDLYSDAVRQVQSTEGIVKNVAPALDAHKLRTVKGQMKKAKQDCAYLLNACEEAETDLDKMTDEWAFLSED
jgi:hypothetical protein